MARTRDFWRHVHKTDGCWLWTAAKRGIYGKLTFLIDGKAWSAHRYSWFLHFGPIPRGKWVLHRCDNGLCVRPDHLFLGTPRDNALDMVGKGRGVQNQGERQGGHKLTTEQAMIVKALPRRPPRGTISRLAREWGVHRGTLGDIHRGRNWRHL